MSDFTLLPPDLPPFPSRLRSAPARRCVPMPLQMAEDCQYREMEDAFRASGGIVGSDEITTLLRRHTDRPVSLLTGWIVAHDVLRPLFQFDLSTMTLRTPATEVIRELVRVLSDWESRFGSPGRMRGSTIPRPWTLSGSVPARFWMQREPIGTWRVFDPKLSIDPMVLPIPWCNGLPSPLLV